MARPEQSLRSEVREFLDSALREGRFTPRCDAWVRASDPDFSRELGSRGWIGMTWPSEYGGSDRSNLERLVVTEELLRVGAPVAFHWIGDRQIGPAILRYGSAFLKRSLLPRIASGEIGFCLGMSESEAGSDLAAIRTRAVQTDDGWRLTGRKIWTSQAHIAHYAYVLARTESGSDKRDGLSEFIVDLASPGVEIRPIIDLHGEHHFNEMVFDHVHVPNEYLLGELGKGWEQVTSQLAFERGGPERFLSTYPLLVEILDNADPSMASQIGELVARLDALREFSRSMAIAMDAGEAPIHQSAMLKILGTRFENDVIEVARQLVAITPAPATRLVNLMTDALMASPGFTIRGGSTEILNVVVARAETA